MSKAELVVFIRYNNPTTVNVSRSVCSACVCVCVCVARVYACVYTNSKKLDTLRHSSGTMKYWNMKVHRAVAVYSLRWAKNVADDGRVPFALTLS
jgi:hypothetical protein